MAREWVRCEDPDTGHQFDVREDRITDAHRVVEGYPTSLLSRPPKARAQLAAAEFLGDDNPDPLDPSGSDGDQTSTEET